MARRDRAPIRLDIVGLDPTVFDICVKNTQSLLESRPKGSPEVSSTVENADTRPELQSISPGALEVHKKIALIAIDFQRAYGRSVEVRVFEKSSNRFVEMMSRSKRRTDDLAPEFLVNGVKVFKGIPQSFSQLDEAIDKAFGRSGGI